MLPCGCGQPWMRFSPPPNISDAGSTALPMCKPSYPSDYRPTHAGGCVEMAEAETQKTCRELHDRYVADLVTADQRPVAEAVLRDWEKFVTFYHYPMEHWIHLRTTNRLESIFSGVRLRTNAAKRLRRRDNALYLVFKIVERLSRHWQPLNRGTNLMALVLEGETFKDGMRQRRETRQLVTTVA